MRLYPIVMPIYSTQSHHVALVRSFRRPVAPWTAATYARRTAAPDMPPNGHQEPALAARNNRRP
jgi:hypothetical protein